MNNYIQQASTYIGHHGPKRKQRKRKIPAIIHILDYHSEQILATLENKQNSALFWDDVHRHEQLQGNKETFHFKMKSDAPASQHVTGKNHVVIPDEDGNYIEFIIKETVQKKNRVKVVRTAASYTELRKDKIIPPGKLEGQTIISGAQYILQGTEWQLGYTEYAGSRTIEYEEHTNALRALRLLAAEFDKELRFRVEVKGNRIVGRYVDFVEITGYETGKEIELGKDLIDIERIENTEELVTALVCIGPEKEDGSRLILNVEDDDARQRWGKNGRHLWDIYVPDSTDDEMTEERLEQLGRTELNKRINTLVKYTATTAAIEHIFGREHEKVRISDRTRIKDTSFQPALYLSAKVIVVERSISDPSKKYFELGDYIEYSQEQIEKTLLTIRQALKVRATKQYIRETKGIFGGPGNENGYVTLLDEENNIIGELGTATSGIDDFFFNRLKVNQIIAPDIAYISDVNQTVYVRGSAGSDESDGRNWDNGLYSIREALNRIPTVVNGTTEIMVSDLYDINEGLILFDGRIGAGNVVLNLRGNKAKIRLRLGGNTCRFFLRNGDIEAKDGTVYVIDNDASSYVEITNCTINGAGQQQGIRTWNGGMTKIEGCEVYNVDTALRTTDGGRLFFRNVVGLGNSYGLQAQNGSDIRGAGNAPAGVVGNKDSHTNSTILGDTITHNSGSATQPAPPVTEVTKVYKPTSAASWRPQSTNWRPGEVAQGYWGGWGLYRGFWFIGDAIRNDVMGKTIKRIRAKLRRLSTSHGQVSGAQVVIRTHTLQSRPTSDAQPSAGITLSPSHTVSFDRGETKWVTLPSTFHAAFTNGDRCLGIYTSSTAGSGYAFMDTSCEIEITYEG